MSVSAVFDGGLFKIIDAFPYLLNLGWRKLDLSLSCCSSRKGWRRFSEAWEGSETWSGLFPARLGRCGISRFRCHKGPVEWEMGNGDRRTIALASASVRLWRHEETSENPAWEAANVPENGCTKSEGARPPSLAQREENRLFSPQFPSSRSQDRCRGSAVSSHRSLGVCMRDERGNRFSFPPL